MDKEQFDDLIRLLKLIGGKFIIVEDGDPRAVLMDYREFQELAAPYYTEKITEKFSQKVEAVNTQITRAQLEDLRAEVIAEIPEEEVRIEPLDPH